MSNKLPTRGDYHWVLDLQTRWMDNDVYGHVNNVVYYSYFDTVANRYLIEEGGLDIDDGSIVGFVVNSGCEYHAPIAYPEPVEAGVRVDKLGNSSVQYGIAIFKKGQPEAVAHGHFVHVFVERAKNQSVPIPANLRAALEKIQVD